MGFGSAVFKTVFVLITLVLVAMFAMAGTNKVSPVLDANMHKYLNDGAEKYWPGVFNPVFEKVGLQISPSNKFLNAKTLVRVIGMSEIAGAAGLLLSLFVLPSFVGTLASVGLSYIMLNAIYFHIVTNTDTTICIVLLGLLGLRILMALFAPSSRATKGKKE